MTPDDLDNDVRRLWRSQPEDVPGLSLDVVRRRSQQFEGTIRRRNYVEYAAAVFVVAVVVPRIWRTPNHVLALAGAALVAGIAYVMYRIHTAGSQRALPSELGVRSGVEFLRTELERQRDLLQNIWSWYVLPLWPGMALLLLGQVIARPERWPFALGTAAFAVLVGFQIAWMNKRGARMLQDVIDKLEEDPVAALSSPPPRPTVPQRLNGWFMLSLAGAGVVLVAIRQFFPEVITHVPGLMRLPGEARYPALLAVFIPAGMALQALWWILRGRK